MHVGEQHSILLLATESVTAITTPFAVAVNQTKILWS